MEDIFRGDTNLVIGGAGRYMVAAKGTTKPSGIHDIMATAWPYMAKSPWIDLGYTREGLTIGRGRESQEHKVDQIKGAYDETTTSWSHEIKTQLAQTSLTNLQMVWEGGAIDDHAEQVKVDTTIDAAAEAGQKTVTVKSKTGLAVGRTCVIGTGNTQEAGILASISDDPTTTVTMQDNLLYAHVATETFSQIALKAYKELPFGRPTAITERLFAAVFMKPDGLLRVYVFWRVMISPDMAELGPNTFEDDNKIPLGLVAYEDTADATLQDDEKVFKIFDEYATA